MPEVEAPEIEVDEDAPLFRRRMALVVVFITLFAAFVAYLHEQNSNLEDNAAREAQIQSIKGFGQQVAASTQSRFDYRLFVQHSLLERQHIVAAARQRSTADQSLASLYGNDSDRFTQLGDEIGKDAPVTDQKSFLAVDSKLQTTPDKARLSQEVFSNKANDYGNKADAYVALLTVLAVGLFLIGLSLTVSGRGRYYLALPGVAIAIVCVCWAMIITLGGVTKVSDNSIDLTAQGSQLQASGNASGAIEKFKAAIADSPQFGSAYARLADAEFIAGGSGEDFQSISDRDATRRAIAAGEKAISLGEASAPLLSDIGFYHFTLGEYDRAEELAQNALTYNDQFPVTVFNLGVVQVARGDASAAEATYKRAIDLLANEKDDGLRLEILRGARTDLEIAATNTPSSKDLAQKMRGLLAVVEGPMLTPKDSLDKLPQRAPEGAAVTNVAINVDSFNRLVATYDTDGFGPEAALVNVWYFRPPGRNGPFEQVNSMDSVSFTAPTVETLPVEKGECLEAGDYRVDVYAGTDLVGTADFHKDDSPLGSLLVEGGEDAGFTLCRPDGWKSQDVTGLPGSMAFSNPDAPEEAVVVLSFPIGTQAGSSGATLLDAMIQDVLLQQQLHAVGAPQSGQQLLGRTVEGLDVLLSTTTVTAADAAGHMVRISGSAGADGVVRLVIVAADDANRLEVVRQELANSVRFLRVPNASP